MNNLCKIPFKELYIEQAKDGIAACCQQKTVKDLTKNSLTDNFYNNDFLKKLRQDFLDGKRPEECSRCWALEDQGLTSYRTTMARGHVDTDLELKSLDIRLGNKCNLACKMCTPEYSNQLAKKMYDAIQDGSYIPSPDKNNPEWQEILKTGDAIRPVNHQLVDNIFNTVLENPSIEQLKFGGGEPFIMPEVTLLLQKLVDADRAKNIHIFSLTNCTTIKTSFIELLKNFKSVEISCSIDGVGKWIEFQRTGCNWESIKKNYAKLKKQEHNNWIITLTPVITQLNLLGVAEFLKWAINEKPQYIAFNEVNHPKHFRWQTVPMKYRKKLINELESINLKQHFIDTNWIQFKKNLKTELHRLNAEDRHKWSGDLILWEHGAKDNEKYFVNYPWGKDLYEGNI